MQFPPRRRRLTVTPIDHPSFLRMLRQSQDFTENTHGVPNDKGLDPLSKQDRTPRLR